MRYANKSVTLDGKQYNIGDIVPYNLKDEESAKMATKEEGRDEATNSKKPAKAFPAKKGGNASNSGLSTKNVPAQGPKAGRRRTYRARTPRTTTNQK